MNIDVLFSVMMICLCSVCLILWYYDIHNSAELKKLQSERDRALNDLIEAYSAILDKKLHNKTE